MGACHIKLSGECDQRECSGHDTDTAFGICLGAIYLFCIQKDFYGCDVFRQLWCDADRPDHDHGTGDPGSDQYSLKIEFDHYNAAENYYGLDKLCLNNIIQDNTYMKDFLSYQLMREAGVPSPLCSYAYLTVDGEDWGLYLAVEDVEDAFLERNYGSDHGEL